MRTYCERWRTLHHCDVTDSPAAEQPAADSFYHPVLAFAERQLVHRAEGEPPADIVRRRPVVRPAVVVVRIRSAILTRRGSDVVGILQELRISGGAHQVQAAREAFLDTNHASVVIGVD